MSQVDLLREQLRQAEEFLETTLSDVTAGQAHWSPPGSANPLGATLAHLITGEDAFVGGMLAGKGPLGTGAWADRTGLSEPPPPPFPPKPWNEWGRRLRVDLEALRGYGIAVFAATDEYLASLDDGNLARTMDLSVVGLGEQTLGWVISNAVLGHRLSHWGEISCLKGLQGGKGFPF